MATPTLLVASLIVGGLLFALLFSVVGRKPKREVPIDDDSPFADLFAKNRAGAGALPSAVLELATRSGSEPAAASAPTGSAAPADASPGSAQLESLLRADLQAGHKITAIKRLRDATGLGLKEAKEAVERFHATGQLHPSQVQMHPPALVAPSPHRAAASLDHPAVAAHARAFLARGQKLQAIKAVREMTSCGLKEAKDFVERL